MFTREFSLIGGCLHYLQAALVLVLVAAQVEREGVCEMEGSDQASSGGDFQARGEVFAGEGGSFRAG